MRVEGFVIHLERAMQRRPQVDRLLSDLPMPASVVDAVDGAALSQVEIDSVYRRNLWRPRYPFELGKGEIGCFLSHRKAWREILDRGLDAGLIVEDDVAVEREALERTLGAIEATACPADFVRVPQKVRGESGPVVASGAGCPIIRPNTPAYGMIMQVVGREAAARLLEITECFDRPVDAVIQMRWLHGARVLSTRPVIVSEISGALGGTLAQSKRKTLLDTIGREVRRPIYRGMVRLRNWLEASSRPSSGP